MEATAKLKLHIPFSPIHDSMYLACCSGKLILVHPNMFRTNPMCFDYDVYQLDLDTKKLLLTKSLSGGALFIGMHSPLSVSTEVFPSIAGDVVYFSEGTREQLSMLRPTIASIEMLNLQASTWTAPCRRRILLLNASPCAILPVVISRT
jgi:hypothetical protein